MTTWSSMMEERVDKSEAQSALRVVQALFAFVKKKKKKKLSLVRIKLLLIKILSMSPFKKIISTLFFFHIQKSHLICGAKIDISIRTLYFHRVVLLER